MPFIKYQGRDVEAEEVDFVTRREDWNEYQLLDGTVLKMKLIAADVYRIKGEYDAEGNPIYVIKSSNVVSAKSPDELKRPKSG